MKSLLLPLSIYSWYAGAFLLRQTSPLDQTQWIRGHQADADNMLHVSIGLKIQNADLGVETLLRISDPKSADYGQQLSAKEVSRLFKPEPNNVSNVMKWIEESNIEKKRIISSHGGDRLSLFLSVQEATLLLETTFHHQTHQDTGKQQISCLYYYIPESLAGSIDYILARSPAPTHQHIPRQQIVLNDKVSLSAPLPPACLTYTTLPCLRSLYSIPNDTQPHPDNSLEVFEPSWISWLEEDLDKFFGQWQPDLVGKRPKVDAVNGGYLQRNYTGTAFNLEPNLDFEYTMALTSPQEVTNVQVGSHDHQGNLHDMLAAFDRYFCDPTNPQDRKYPDIYPPGCNATACDCGSSSPPKVLSISWGWTEAGFTPSYLQRQCLEFLKLGLMGTTVVVSISDHGTASGGGEFCIDNNDKTGNTTGRRFSPVFPASCPWVTSIGGTQMLQPTDPRVPGATTNETTFRKVVFGKTLSSGGSFSNVFSAPLYQTPQVASYKDIEKDHLDEIQDRFNSTGRGYPDVSLRADNYWIVTNGKWLPVSGTSASNPVFASMITLINSERMRAGKVPVGFINQVLYSNPDILNDIVTGANQGCGVDQAFRATRGWDAVTGLGSPDYERVRDLFMSLP